MEDKLDRLVELTFIIPDKNAPGFLSRQRKALGFSAALKQDPTPETLDALVEFLADYVVGEKDASVEQLWAATQAEFEQLLELITGQADEAVDPEAEGS